MQHLQPNSTLQGGKYKIEKVLGQGGFGITYLAEQVMLGRKVAVKEFFMKELCERDESTSHVTLGTEGSRETVNRFREKFLKEARNIARLNYPNIVRIIDVFEENGTAYYVMDYIEGESLSDMVKRRGSIPEEEAVGYIREVGGALSYIHGRSMNHLDIKPSNIMRRKEDGQIFVIDFGVAKQYDEATFEGTTTTPVGISKGYSPNEQYVLSGVQSFSPQSDVYALAATLYKLLTGITPPEAMLVQDEGLPIEELKSKTVSQQVINALDAAMRSKRNRTQSIEEFISNLSSFASDIINSDDTTTLTPDVQRTEKQKRKEAKVKVAKEMPEAETRATNKAVHKVGKKEDQNRKEAEVNTNKFAQISRLKNVWLWGLLGVIALAVIIIGVYSKGDVFVNQNNISFSNGVLNVNGVTYEMVKVQAGTFTMTINKYRYLNNKDDSLTHEVTLTNDYYIGKTEVTQALWKAVMGNNPSLFKGDNLPVENVSWHECKEFISKLNSITGQDFRLPTEAEWEFAARGGNKSNNYLYSGSNTLGDVGWYDWNSGGTTQPVATKQPNELGIYDMSGNVEEWCSDWYENYCDVDELTNPTGADSGDEKVHRGGSTNTDACDCKTTRCSWCSSKPDMEDAAMGLRLAISRKEKAKDSKSDEDKIKDSKYQENP